MNPSSHQPFIQRNVRAAAVLAAALALSFGITAAIAAEKKGDKDVKPYPLKTCIVSDEALGGDHGEPYVFVHKGQEIKMCCKPCKKDFDKEPAKYLKKLAKAEPGKK